MIRPLHLLAAAAAVALAASAAAAQTVPFKITGAGAGPTGLPLPGQAPRPHWVVGEATYLGRHTGEGTVRTDSAAPGGPGIVGEFGSGSPFVFTGANGDQLAVYYGRTDKGASAPGTFALTVLGMTGDGSLVVEAAWVAEW